MVFSPERKQSSYQRQHKRLRPTQMILNKKEQSWNFLTWRYTTKCFHKGRCKEQDNKIRAFHVFAADWISSMCRNPHWRISWPAKSKCSPEEDWLLTSISHPMQISKWIKGLNVRHKTVKMSEEHNGEDSSRHCLCHRKQQQRKVMRLLSNRRLWTAVRNNWQSEKKI